MPEKSKDLIYRSESREEYRFNPLIEALPSPLGEDEILPRLRVSPPYDQKERLAPGTLRLRLTDRLFYVHEPLPAEAYLYRRIERAICEGYARRNPLPHNDLLRLRRESGLCAPDPPKEPLEAAGHFSVIGLSGMGKSTAAQQIISLYPAVIRHEAYQGIPLERVQIPVLLLRDLLSISVTSLCLRFLGEIDHKLGTDYLDQSFRRGCGTEKVLTSKMAELCETFQIGMLVLDDLDKLCTASEKKRQKILDFLRSLRVPVVMIGTPKALRLLKGDFHPADGGDDRGDLLFSKMEAGEAFERFCGFLWRWQYTGRSVPLFAEMTDALYELSQGIPSLVTSLYRFVQSDAILSGKETFSVSDLYRSFSLHTSFLKPMLEALKTRDKEALSRFEDIAPLYLGLDD